MPFLLAARAFLGRIPREVWLALAVALALFLIWHWHEGKVSAAYKSGATKQAAADRLAFERAEKAATARQSALIAKTEANGAEINKETVDALEKRNTQLAHSYDDLRLRWAAYRADQSRAGNSAATAVPGSPASPVDAHCAASGWVSFDVAAAASEAADTAIAKDDAWRAWYQAQREAWPK